MRNYDHKVGYPVSVSMTPAFYDAENILLRAQLKCLSVQTVKDFDVWLIDPHYQKRKAVIPELAERFKLDIKHIPYTPNTRISKHYDCAIFNAAFCYSMSPVSVRYSCYRFARPTFIERILSAPPGVNIDFYMHAVGPEILESILRQEHKFKHKAIWDFNGEDIRWDLVPERSGYTDDTGSEFNGDPALSLGNWMPFMDHDSGPERAPLNIYGNIAWQRAKWLALNGTNEVITNAAHWEDLDFDCRANNAKQQVVRYAHQLYRLQHTYGEFSQRSNVQVDTPLTPPCPPCRSMVTCNGGDADFGQRVRARIGTKALTPYYKARAWVCNQCHLSGPIYDELGLDHYFFHLQHMGNTKAPVLPIELIGRNLSVLTEHMDNCPYLSSKVEIYNNSWENPYYYVET